MSHFYRGHFYYPNYEDNKPQRVRDPKKNSPILKSMITFFKS